MTILTITIFQGFILFTIILISFVFGISAMGCRSGREINKKNREAKEKKKK